MTSEALFSFWEHVEDLRTTLIRIFIVISLGFLVSLYFNDFIFSFLVDSYSKEAVSTPSTTNTLQYQRVTNSSQYPLIYDLPTQASILKQSEAVRQLTSSRYQIEAGHYIDYEIPISNKHKLLIISPLEGIILVFKICFWISLAATSPLWIYFLLQFILPGLESREKRVILPFIFGSLTCIALGFTFAYFFTIPLANGYLEAFNSKIGENLWSLSNYVDYTLILFLGHGIAFEIGFFLLLMVHFRLLPVEWLIQKRRYMIVCAFILGAILTPPDVLTQLMLALPLIGIYEIAIIYGKIRSLT